MPRLFRIGGSLAIVLTVYWAYALLAVPLIEPTVNLERDRRINEADHQQLRPTAARVRELQGLFAADAWEMQNPKILESERLKLLMQSYRNLGDGRIEITPCTLIFLPEEPAEDPAERHRRAVVLEAHQGAVLRFDEPIDPLRGKIGNPVGGELVGTITIRSQGNSTGPEDDLLIVTRDVELTQRHVWTPHTVDFQWGRSYGRGRQLHIELLEEKEPGGVGPKGPSIAGIKLFEVKQIERVHVEVEAAKGRPSAQDAKAQAAGEKPLAALAGQPVELSCRGPFVFDVLGKTATFKDRVDLWRIQPDGPSDQLSCELLTLRFVDRDEEKPGAEGGPAGAQTPALKDRLTDSLALRLASVEARGDPVTVSMPSQQASARGQTLQYDLAEGRLRLQGSEEVVLKQGENEVHARGIDYRAAPGGEVGEVYARGPGWLKGQMDDRPEQRLEARWNELLEVRPQEDSHLISLRGGSSLRFRGIGQLDAAEIHFWLRRTASKLATGQRAFQPDRMLARGQVHVSSEKLTCAVEEMKIWFEQAVAAATAQAGIAPLQRAAAVPGLARQGPPGPRAGGLPVRQLPPVGNPALPGAVTGQWPAARAPATGAYLHHTAYRTSGQRQHFEVVGRQLLAKVLVREGEQVALSELTIRDGVQLVETQTARPDEQPISVQGGFVQVVDADKPHAAVTVTGSPAAFSGRGLALRGPSIALNRGTNQLLVDGAGAMDVRLDRDLEGRPLSQPGNLRIDFSRSMLFDGRTAEFGDVVRATAPNAQLDTKVLKVQFQQPIRFDQKRPAAQPQVEQVVCSGGAVMQSRTFDGARQVSEEWIEVADLSIHLPSGDVNASGPGWVSSVRRGIANPMAQADAPVPGAAAGFALAAAPPANDDQRSGLHVRFQGSATGNLRSHDLAFHDRVQTAFAAVDAWDAKLPLGDPDALPAGGVAMNCNRLGVHEMAAPLSERRAIEIEAAEDVVVEGRMTSGFFTARAVRMTYAEDKGLLVLEGNGHTPAELFRQQQIGGPQSRLAAGRILFWPKENRFTFNNPQAVEINGLPSGSMGP